MVKAVSAEVLEEVSAVLEKEIGLHFPRERWADLTRGLESAAPELGCADSWAAAKALLHGRIGRTEIEVLGRHLTIGETYFQREPRALEALEREVFPAMIRERRGVRQQINIWSAACATGEEAYTIAMMLAGLLPDIKKWKVHILGSDINSEFLRKARAGVYGNWSFRGDSSEFQLRHFTRTPEGRYAIHQRYRDLVTFERQNLMEDTYPPLRFDLILCRNVLMYFAPEQMSRVIAKLQGSLVEGGWLVTSAAEAGPVFAPLVPVSFPGAQLYRKSTVTPMANSLPAPAPMPAQLPLPPLEITPKPPGDLDLAMRQADEGTFAEALRSCDRALQADRVNPAAHYLRGVILQELLEPSGAAQSFQRALYLDRGHVPSCMALASLMRKENRPAEERKYIDQALQKLARLKPDEWVADTGMTARQLREMLSAPANRA